MNFKLIFLWALKLTFYITTTYFALPFFYYISLGLYNNFFLSSLSFDLDTLFLNWNTSFPAVTVCEIYNGEKLWDTSEQHFGVDHDLRIDDFVGEVVFFRGTCTTCDRCELMECPQNFTELLQVFRTKCSEMIMNCRYIDELFNCCEKFLPIKTEYGLCYSFNSNQAQRSAQVQYANSRSAGTGSLKFEALVDIQLHVHPPIEIPNLFSEGMIRETVLLGSVKEIVVNVMEVWNHMSVERLTLEERRCRFAHERTQWGQTLDLYEFYSFTTCIVECTLNVQMDYCNCTNHFLASNYLMKKAWRLPMCDSRGLTCLSEHFYDMQEERKSCDCQSTCEEPEYNIVFNSADEESEHQSERTQVKVSLIELPTQRYVRRVTRNYLDLIISIGGIAGLFFNASLIRVIELIFLLLKFKWYISWRRIL